MPVAETTYEHIVLNEDHTPVIEGSTMKVIELVQEHLGWGWSPEELHLNHPYLTLGQIHSALAYYWDHKEELDQEIERRMARVEQLRQSLGPTPLVERLKAKGLL
jgi:uncharacterized protein (DUF433 family)